MGAGFGVERMIARLLCALCVLAGSCDEPLVQIDTSGMGDSPIARRAYASSSSGTEDFVEQGLAYWFEEQCPLDRTEMLFECATALGMTCEALEELSCRYRGVLRSRMINRRSPSDYEPRDTAWSTQTISIEVRFAEGKGPLVDIVRSTEQ